ncbi:thioredoxin domain-containing protein, partial [Acephala macrosclerotiorum]
SYEDFKKIIQSRELVALDAWATWCGPCRTISPLFERLSGAEKYAGKIAFYKLDVDDQPEVSQELGVRVMPTFIFFRNGK